MLWALARLFHEEIALRERSSTQGEEQAWRAGFFLPHPHHSSLPALGRAQTDCIWAHCECVPVMLDFIQDPFLTPNS